MPLPLMSKSKLRSLFCDAALVNEEMSRPRIVPLSLYEMLFRFEMLTLPASFVLSVVEA